MEQPNGRDPRLIFKTVRKANPRVQNFDDPTDVGVRRRDYFDIWHRYYGLLGDDVSKDRLKDVLKALESEGYETSELFIVPVKNYARVSLSTGAVLV
jgi:hypothetical protein